MASPVVIFEDPHFEDLYPLTLTRPVFDLRCGALTLAGKAGLALGLETGGAGRRAGEGRARAAGGRAVKAAGSWGPSVLFHVRSFLHPVLEGTVESYSRLLEGAGHLLLVNGRALFDPGLAEALEPGWRGLYTAGGAVVAAGVGREEARALDSMLGGPLDPGELGGLPSREVKARLVNYPWDLVKHNGAQIASDAGLLGLGGAAVKVPAGVHLVNESAVHIAPDASLAPGVVLDASEGPVIIEHGAAIMANASLKGPLYLGERSVVKMGACIYGETTIGPGCKVGGEVAESIVHGFSNKQHGGFLGHSYLGEWTNLGAGTETSDLKNNYSTVKVRLHRETMDSGELFAGLYMGDHSKCGIGTTFNTGTAVGACCNVFGAGYPPKFIPSFVWGGAAGFEEYRPEKALSTAARAMGRRGKELAPGQAAVLKHVYGITRESREAFMKGA